MFTVINLDKLFKRLDIKITSKNRYLYEEAFSHSSYVNEGLASKSYERLEFLGDAVLELAVSTYLFNENKDPEGEMTKIRASYVCEDALYEYAKSLNLSEYIKVGHGEEASGGRFKKVIMADIFEALMGAIYLDLGFEEAKRVILDIIVPYMKERDDLFVDYKTLLQEAVQTEKRSLEYNLVSEFGPAHDKTFEMELKIDNIVYGKGVAGSKKEAMRMAAKSAYQKLIK